MQPKSSIDSTEVEIPAVVDLITEVLVITLDFRRIKMRPVRLSVDPKPLL